MCSLVHRLKVGETGHAYVVDRKGRLIAFGDTGRVLRGEILDDLKNVSEFMRNPVHEDGGAGASVSTGINGSSIVGTHVSLKTPDWAVMTVLPVKEAYRQVMRSVMISAGILLVMAVPARLTGISVAHRLAAPILNLTETATRITGGDMGLKAGMEGPLEVASLASAFNNMTQRLKAMLDIEAERSGELAREVEQRKKAQEALKESESVLRATLESTQEGLLVVNHSGKVSHHNSRFGEIWSIPGALLASGEDNKLIAHVLPQLVDPEQFNSKIKEVYQSSKTTEDLLHLKDGRILDRFSSPLVRDGRETGRVWFFRDVTERKRTAESLRFTQFSFDKSAVGIYYIGSDF
jgi:PAS domain-containing protein